MRSYPWHADEGWPYSDADLEVIDQGATTDDDLLSVKNDRHLFDDLDPLERQVVGARFGLSGQRVRTMKELQHETGIPRADLKLALGSGLAKLRTHLIDH